MSMFTNVVCYPNLLPFEPTEAKVHDFMSGMASAGVTHVQVNHLPDLMHPELLNQPDNVYLWFANFGPALDMFVASDLNRGLYPEPFIDRNRRLLLRFVEAARSHGIKPLLYLCEPRFVPERFYQRYPTLRGARVDNPMHSRQPIYALSVDRAQVQRHYRQMMARIMELVPDLAMVTLFTSDSGAGFEYNPDQYAGPNGSGFNADMPLEDRVVGFIRCIGEPARAVNPEFTFNLTSGFHPVDREKILDAAPEWVHGSTFGLYDWIGGLEEFWAYHQTVWSHGGPMWAIQSLDREAARKWRYDDMKQRFDIASRGGRSPIVHAEVPGHDYPRPLRYVPHPFETVRVIRETASLGADKLAAWGVMNPPGLITLDINREAMREALTDANADADTIVRHIAERSSGGDDAVATVLVEAWRRCNEAHETRPLWHHIGLAKRWLPGPLVPDFHALTIDEQSYFMTVSLEDLDRVKGVGYHVPAEADERKRDYVLDEIYAKVTLPELDAAATMLSEAARAQGDHEVTAVLHEQADFVRLAWLFQRSCRNWYEAGRHLRPGEAPGMGRTMAAIVDDEIEVTESMIALTREQPGRFFRIMPLEGMTYEIGPTFIQQLEARANLMRAHRDDPPQPVQGHTHPADSPASTSAAGR